MKKKKSKLNEWFWRRKKLKIKNACAGAEYKKAGVEDTFKFCDESEPSTRFGIQYFCQNKEVDNDNTRSLCKRAEELFAKEQDKEIIKAKNDICILFQRKIFLFRFPYLYVP